MLWKIELQDVGFQAFALVLPFRKALFCFVWLYTVILVELRAFHCCLWLVAYITPISFGWNDDPRRLEFDPRKWQEDDRTGDDHRISDHKMGINNREASSFCTSPLPGPTFGTAPTAPAVERGSDCRMNINRRKQCFLDFQQDRYSIDHLTCLPSEAIS